MASATTSVSCGWSGGFHPSDLSNPVRALAVYDDGNGPALYAGGWFTSAGDVVASRIAKWDGTAWSALSGPSGNGVDNRVYALAVYDDGSGPALYVGGLFASAGGVMANNIAKWDGTAWSALLGPSSNGLNGPVYTLAVYDDGSGPALYAGGTFTSAGAVAASNVAKWNGTEWSTLPGLSGDGTSGPVHGLVVFDDTSGPALYVGGDFTAAGGVTVNSIAKWDGTGWTALSGPTGIGANSSVWALAVHNDGSGAALYVGGSFTSAGGVTASRVAKWTGTAWLPLAGPSGDGVNGSVYSLTVFDDGSGPALHVGGNFTSASGAPASSIAKWDGTAWFALSGPSGNGTGSYVLALANYNDGSGPALYAAGDFTSAGGLTVGRVAKWSGTAWSSLSKRFSHGINGDVRAFAVYDDGSGPALYAGGSFTSAGGVRASSIARWNGTAWSTLTGPEGSGVIGQVRALAVFDDGSGPALYVGGEFSSAGGVPVNSIAKWNGTAWSVLAGPSGFGFNGPVNALAVYDDGTGPALYVGGEFTAAGGVPANRVAKWNGTAWSALVGPAGNGISGTVRALTVYNDGSGPALHAVGSFTSAGGVTARFIAKWNGTSWSAISTTGNSPNSSATTLAVYDDGSGSALYVGGWFSFAGGAGVNYIAKWNGTAWSALAGPSGIGVNSTVYALAVSNEGSGPALYAGGDFTSAGGVTATRVAKWNGTAWSPLSGPTGDGPDGSVFTLAPYSAGSSPALFVGGAFGAAGGVASANIARWVCQADLPFANGFENGNLSGWSERTP